MNDEQPLQKIRARIDEIDEQLLQMISERAQCALEIARLKRNEDPATDHYRPEREAAVLQSVQQHNQGPLNNEDMVRLFREIMSVCRALQQPMTVAYLGPEGTFTQAAVFKQFGHMISATPLAVIEDVFREVESGMVSYGVVPIENSTEGVINHTLDTFMNSQLKICGEIELRVHHHLMSKADGLAGIKRIYAHQQTFAQCREWLDGNVPDVEHIAVNSNAEAARRAGDELDAAACGAAAAAELYSLKILKSNIEDEPNNTTRFLVIGRRLPAPSGNDKTSLLLSAPNRPGALYRLLKPFSAHDISLTRIESRPSRRAIWEYVFFVDSEGHVQDEKVASAIEELQADAYMVKVLGSYPKAIL